MSEYMRTHDYLDGMRIVFDLSDINVLEFGAKMDLVLTKQALGIYQVSEYELITTNYFIGATI